MKKLFALIFLTIVFFGINIGTVKAVGDWYEVGLVRNVFLDGDYKYNIVNTFTLSNISDKYVITSLDYFSPFPFTDAEALIGDKKLNIEVNGTHLLIELGENFLKPLSKLELIVKLKVPDLFISTKNSKGQILGVQLFLPKDVTKALNIYTQTKIFYDSKNLIPTYISTEVVLDANSIQYSRNVDLFMSFSQIGGVSVDYKGKSEEAMLPSTKINKVIYENIPEDADLSNDSWGNNYISSKEKVNYKINAVQKDKNEWGGLTNTYNLFFSKEELSGFDFGKEKRELYFQLLTKFVPEKEKLKVQYSGLSEINKGETQDSLAYALTYASILQQKGIDSYVVFGRVQFPLSSTQSWNFWVVEQTDNSYNEIDPYMEDLLGFDGYSNIPQNRLIFCVYANDAKIINGINRLIKSELELNFLTNEESRDQMLTGKLNIVSIPESLYPMLGLNFKNLSSEKITIKGIYLNDVFAPFTSVIEMEPGTQKNFDVYIGLNIFDLLINKGVFKATAKVQGGDKEYYFSSSGKIPASTFYWVFGINLGVILLGGIFFVVKYKRSKKL